MAEFAFNPTRLSPLAGVDQTGVNADGAKVTLQELTDSAMVQLFARKGYENEVAELLGIGGEPGLASVGEGYTALPLAPGQWLVTARKGGDGAFCGQLREHLSGRGFVSEQSHGRVILRVSGPAARELMQKGCRLDLHPTVAQPGFCAQTSMAQVGVLIHLVDDEPTFDLHVYSGFARSFWHWLTESAAQLNYRVVT